MVISDFVERQLKELVGGRSALSHALQWSTDSRYTKVYTDGYGVPQDPYMLRQFGGLYNKAVREKLKQYKKRERKYIPMDEREQHYERIADEVATKLRTVIISSFCRNGGKLSMSHLSTFKRIVDKMLKDAFERKEYREKLKSNVEGTEQVLREVADALVSLEAIADGTLLGTIDNPVEAFKKWREDNL